MPHELAYTRIQTGKQSSLCNNGSYISAGFSYLKEELPLFSFNSPLLNQELAEKAVKANRNGNYFTTLDKILYIKQREIAEMDKTKDPEKRRVLILPERKNFVISPTENQKILYAIFNSRNNKIPVEDLAGKYLKFLNQDNILVNLIDPKTVDSLEGTVLTQAWLYGLGGRSGLGGGSRSLKYGSRVRGVQKETAEGSLQNIKNIKLPYSPKEIKKYSDLIQKVRKGDIPNSKLEKVIIFLDKLKG